MNKILWCMCMINRITGLHFVDNFMIIHSNISNAALSASTQFIYKYN